MRKVTEIKSNECIHCRTKSEYDAIIDLLDKAGKRWNGGRKLDDAGWIEHDKNVCINPIGVWRSPIEYYKSEGYTILPASDFISEFQWGEEVEVSMDGQNWVTMKFVGMNPLGTTNKYVASDGCVGSWDHCRKANPERAKIEAQIKELQKKLKNF